MVHVMKAILVEYIACVDKIHPRFVHKFDDFAATGRAAYRFHAQDVVPPFFQHLRGDSYIAATEEAVRQIDNGNLVFDPCSLWFTLYIS